MHVRRVIAALVAGLIVGSVIGSSQTTAGTWTIALLAPVGQLWVNAIRMTVVPLVVALLFVSVATGGSVEGLGRLGAVTLASFFGVLVFAGVVAVALGPPLIGDMHLASDAASTLRGVASGGARATVSSAASLPGFGGWVTSLVPANVMKAAADGAMLPLIVFTLLLALASRRIDAPLRQALLGFFEAIGAATTRMVEWIIAAAPVGIFALVVTAASRFGAGLAGAMAYYILAICAALLLFALLMYPLATVIGRIPLGLFVRAAAPAQAVALGSSSSLASLPALVEGARALGLPPTVSGFVLPLSVSTFKAATPITWMIGTLFLAKLYGVTVGTTALLTIALTAVALSLTIPGVPQGAQLLLAPLLVTYGIPPEGVALLIAADTIPDLVGTMTNVTGDLVVATIAARLGLPNSFAESVMPADA